MVIVDFIFWVTWDLFPLVSFGIILTPLSVHRHLLWLGSGSRSRECDPNQTSEHTNANTVTDAGMGYGPNLSNQDKVYDMFNQKESPRSRCGDQDLSVNGLFEK